MVTLYRTTDKIEVKIGEISVKVSPLNYEQKSIVNAKIMSGKADQIMDAVRLAVKFSVKEIKGIKLPDGSDYALEFDDKGVSDSCLDDLSNLDQNKELSIICGQLLKGVPSEFTNPETGKTLEGVSIVRKSSGKK
jgi:hypothetical protein